MFTISMMILSVLVTLYFTKPGFKKAVKYFFDMSDKKSGLATPSSDFVSKDYVEEQVPVLTDPIRRESDLGWKRWTKEDIDEHGWDENSK